MVFQRRKKHRPTNVGWDACQAPAQINLLWHSTRAGHWTLWFHTTQWHIIYIIDKIDTPLEPDKWFHSCGLTLTRIPKVATVPPGKKTECMILMCNIYIHMRAYVDLIFTHACMQWICEGKSIEEIWIVYLQIQEIPADFRKNHAWEAWIQNHKEPVIYMTFWEIQPSKRWPTKLVAPESPWNVRVLRGQNHWEPWLVGEHGFYFSIYWECHHPNWRTPSFFRGVGQPPTSWGWSSWTPMMAQSSRRMDAWHAAVILQAASSFPVRKWSTFVEDCPWLVPKYFQQKHGENQDHKKLFVHSGSRFSNPVGDGRKKGDHVLANMFIPIIPFLAKRFWLTIK